MGACTPEEIDGLYAEAYRRADADAVADLYENDAVYAMSVAGYAVVGRDAIRAKVAEMFMVMTDVDLTYERPVRSVVVGDVAYVHGLSRVAFTLGSQRHESVTRSTSVLRRGGDGFWRFAIDHASTP